MSNKKNIAVILTGYDYACTRSHSICNYIIIRKAFHSNFNECYIYVHPSEFYFLYKLYIKFLSLKFKKKISNKFFFRRGWDKNQSYQKIYTVYSSIINDFKKSDNFILIDDSVKKSHIEKYILNL